jgi:hypothetical protein
MCDSTILRGDGSWPWHATIEGQDIVVRNARATCFGGANDPEDSGETASGVSTKRNPSLKGCALPMIYLGRNKALLKALGGSPIPKLPWKTLVEITCGDKKITIPVIDLGPAKRTGNGIDLTIAAAKMLKPNASATNFLIHCDYRILGGAKFAQKGTYA